MSDRPIFYMDIDGVLNLFAADGNPEFIAQVAHIPGYSPLHLTLAPHHRALVAELSEVFEMRWASMWQEHSTAVFAHIVGYGENWPYVPFTRHASSAEMGVSHRGIIDYKIPGIVNDAGDRAFVWADDDFVSKHVEWAESRSAVRAPASLLTTDPAVGLTAGHVEHAKLWASVFA
jgi:hypothetical protein